ncbi:hypothetical protein LINPERPRIM_LOCUS10024 [Linum perenne]
MELKSIIRHRKAAGSFELRIESWEKRDDNDDRVSSKEEEALCFSFISCSIILTFLLGFIIISMDVESRVILDQPNASHHTNILSKVTNAKAMLTINSFEKGRDGGGPSECDGKYQLR